MILPRYSIIVFLALLASCTSQGMRPVDTIVDISTAGGRHVGYGVIVRDARLLTVRHVLDTCDSVCLYRGVLGERLSVGTGTQMSERDIASLTRASVSPGADIYMGEMPLGMPLYTLVSRSGAWLRIDGSVTALDASYVGYDAILSGRVYTGAIETDIVLDAGESGTPIWTLSGELVGVMSAVDRERGRGYIVRP